MDTIRVSANGRYFVRGDGRPFFWLADTAWQLFHRLDRDESDHYLRDRVAKGFTVVQAVATGKIYDDWSTSPNRYGHPPFVDDDPLRPHPGYFGHVDWVVEQAVRCGLRIALLPIWAASGVAGDPRQRLVDASNADYGRWLADRYRGAGIIWVLGGDVCPVWLAESAFAQDDDGGVRWAGERTPQDFRTVYDAMAAGIRAVEGPEALLTYHSSPLSLPGTPHARTSLYFADRDWLDFNMLQSSHSHGEIVDDHGGGELPNWGGAYMWAGPYNYLPVAAEYRSEPTRPVLDGEARYEDHPYENGIWRAYDTRNAAYHALFAGAAGHTYGHVSVWDVCRSDEQVVTPFFGADFERPDWEAALDAPGATQHRHVKALLLSRPYATRIPDDSIVVGDAGHGSDHVSATRDSDRGWAMVYLPRGLPVDVDLTKISGPEAASWWFDPRAGAALKCPMLHPTTGARRFEPPSSGPDQDWILVLDDASSLSFPEPGAPAGNSSA